MYLRKLRLENIRGFDELELDLSEPSGVRLWTVLIGANGTGKTTLLRTIAIGLAAESDANAMLASPIGALVKDGRKFGDITLTVSDGGGRAQKEKVLRTIIKATRTRESIRRDSPEASDGQEPLLLGYGISRVRGGKGEYRGYRIFDSTRTLFDYDAELAPVELTIRRIEDFLGKTSYARAMAGVTRALDLPESTSISIDAGGGVVVHGGPIRGKMPLQGWADGYRLNLAWIVDVYGWALQAGALTKRGGIRGILLVDELEQHTHPSIQTGFIVRLKDLWPELQIVGTTHSPLVVLGADADEVVVLKRHEGGIVATPGAASFAGYSAEDILEDERLFDTPSQRPETPEALSSYEQLAAIPADVRTEAQKNRLRQVARTLGSDPRPDVADSPLLREIRALREKYDL
jgi:energy-coupling factor transporter ATP-binding protein EcfA2